MRLALHLPLLVLLWLLPVAAAHASVLHASPSPGDIVLAGPHVVEITFNKPVVRDFTSVSVTDAEGRSVATSRLRFDESNPTVVRLPIDAPSPSRYSVTWRALTPDGHTTFGSYAIGSGAGADEGSGPGLLASTLASPARGAFYAGLLLCAGLAFYALAVDRDNPKRRVLIAAAAFGALASVAAAVELALLAVMTQAPAASLLSSNTGRSLAARAGGSYAASIGLLVALAWPARAKIAMSVSLAGASIAMVAAALTSHAVQDPEFRILGGVLDVVHLAAAAVWAGGVFALALNAPRAEPGGVGAAMKRFTPWAIGSVALLAATGAFAAYQRLPRGAVDLVTAPYGWILVAKLVLVAVLLSLGAFHRREAARLLQRLTRPFASIARTLRAEAVVMVAVVIATGALATSAPPPPEFVATETPPFEDLTQGTWTTEIVLRLGPTPLVVGEQRLEVVMHPITVRDLPNETRVEVLVKDPSGADMGKSLSLERRGPHTWGAKETSIFPAPGMWSVEVWLERPDEARLLTFPVTVATIAQASG